jgi:hypothetical protein
MRSASAACREKFGERPVGLVAGARPWASAGAVFEEERGEQHRRKHERHRTHCTRLLNPRRIEWPPHPVSVKRVN